MVQLGCREPLCELAEDALCSSRRSLMPGGRRRKQRPHSSLRLAALPGHNLHNHTRDTHCPSPDGSSGSAVDSLTDSQPPGPDPQMTDCALPEGPGAALGTQGTVRKGTRRGRRGQDWQGFRSTPPFLHSRGRLTWHQPPSPLLL